MQNNIVQIQRNNFPDDHTSLAFIMEWVIMSETRKHPASLVEDILAYARETSSNVKYLMFENEQLEKNMHVAKKEAEKL